MKKLLLLIVLLFCVTTGFATTHYGWIAGRVQGDVAADEFEIKIFDCHNFLVDTILDDFEGSYLSDTLALNSNPYDVQCTIYNNNSPVDTITVYNVYVIADRTVKVDFLFP